MKKFTITIPDNKETFFIEMMKSISFVKKIEETTNSDIPEEHKEIVRNRIQKMEEHPESCLSLEEIENEIKLSVTEQQNDLEITPLVESLSGVIPISEDFDLKKEHVNYLTDKYK